MKLHLNIANPAVHNTVRVARIIVRRCVGRFVTPAKSAKFDGLSLPWYDLDIPREDTLILHEDILPMVQSSDLAAYRCPTSSAELVR